MKKSRLVLPAGRAAYPHLDRPDDKFGSPGQYKVSVSYSAEEAAAVKKLILAEAKKLMGSKFKANVKIPLKIKETESGDKEYLVEAKASAKYKPIIVDSKLNKLAAGVSVGRGSLIKLDVAPNFYEMQGGGINLRLYGVQVLELASPAGSLFEAEDGYEAATVSGTAGDDDDAADEAASGDELEF